MINLIIHLKKNKYALFLSLLTFVLLYLLISFVYTQISRLENRYIHAFMDIEGEKVSDALSKLYKEIYISLREIKDTYVKKDNLFDSYVEDAYKKGYYYSISVLGPDKVPIFSYPPKKRDTLDKRALLNAIERYMFIRTNGYAVSGDFIHTADGGLLLPIYFILEDNKSGKVYIEGILRYSELIKEVVEKIEKNNPAVFEIVVEDAGIKVIPSGSLAPHSIKDKCARRGTFARHPLVINIYPKKEFYTTHLTNRMAFLGFLRLLIPIFFSIFVFFLARYKEVVKLDKALNRVFYEMNFFLYKKDKEMKDIRNLCNLILQEFGLPFVFMDFKPRRPLDKEVSLFDIDSYKGSLEKKDVIDKGIKWLAVFPFYIGEKKGALIFGFKSRYDIYREFVEIGKKIAERITLYFEIDNARKEIAESEERYRRLIEEAPLGINIIQSPKGRRDPVIVYTNPKLEEMLGYERGELMGKVHWDLVYHEDRPIVEEKALSRLKMDMPSLPYDIRLVRKDGEIINVSIFPTKTTYNKKVAILTFIIDITEKKRLETEMINRQKAELLGEFVGGLAHNLNNLLTAITGYMEIIKLHILDNEMKKRIKMLEEVVDQTKKISQRLMYITKKKEFKIEDLDLENVVDKVIDMSEVFVKGKKIEFIKNFPKNRKVYVKADDSYLNQIIFNLLRNAIEAISKEGKIILTAECIGEVVELDIIDTGEGIPKEILPHIFKSFVTTKKKGSGLGLYTVYLTVKEMGGDIKVESTPGRGTTFRIYLPRGNEKEMVEYEEVTPLVSYVRKKTILFVDDDEIVLDAGKGMIEALGYKVVAMEDPVLALEFYKKHMDEIDLLILDVKMPKMSGIELYFKIKEINKYAKIILTSGYAEDSQREELREKGLKIKLPKPFDLRTLSIVIREILSQEI